MAKNQTVTVLLAPDVGAIVEYHGTQWRVDSWLRPAERPTFAKHEWLTELLFDGNREIDGHRWTWCTRARATHVSLYAVCGAMAPIEECRVVGRVNWSDEIIAEHRAQALAMVGQMVF